MTYADIFTQILCEVSGKPQKEIAELLTLIRNKKPDAKWDQEIPPEESEKLLNALRKESSGILAFLIKGAMEVALLESKTRH